MRITYICYEDLSEHRGGVAHVLGLVRQLQRQSHQVRLIVPAWQGLRPPGLERVEVVAIPVGSIRIANWMLFYLLSAGYLLFTGRPDVVYIREMVYNVFLLLVMPALRRPLIVEVNALVLDEERMIGAGSARQRFIRWSQAWTFRRAQAIVAVTRGIADHLVRMYGIPPQRVHVVPNGTDPDHFTPEDMAAARERIGLPADIPVIGFVGSCYPYHDGFTLIAAAAKVVAHHADALFLIVGDGYMRPRWMQAVEEAGLNAHFRFTGQVPYERVSVYINACTVCVAPFTRARNEKIGISPMKLYDYMASERPVVGSAIEGVGDLLRVSGGGRAVAPEDPDALAGAIVSMLDDAAGRERMGRQGRQYVIDHHTWAHTTAAIVDVMEKTRKHG